MEHPQTIGTTTRRTCCVTSFFRDLTLIVVSIFVILMAIIGIAWLAMHPHDPFLEVISLSVTNFSVSDSELRGKYELSLTITNPNKKVQLVLDSFNVGLLYGHVLLSEAAGQQSPLFVNKMENKCVKVELAERNSPESVMHEDLVENWNKGVVKFNVKMGVRVRFEAGIWPSREQFLHAYCGDLNVGFSPKETGKLLGVGKDCNIVNAGS